MKFSEALTEYLDLRDKGEFHSEWMSIDSVYETNQNRRDRMAELLDVMDKLTQKDQTP